MVKRRIRDEDEDDDFFGGFFDDFDFDFRKMEEKMMRLLNTVRRNQGAFVNGPFVYGFTYRIGPDGKPSFQEFGNVPEMMRGSPQAGLEQGVREPLTDINEDKDKIYVTFELPGIDKSDIDLNVGEKNITLSVTRGPRKYYKNINVDYKLVPDSTSAKFVNGILDVVISKEKSSDSNGKSIKIN